MMSSSNFDFLNEQELDDIDFKQFLEKVKILSDLEKVYDKTSQFEQDAAFIKTLKPLLSSDLQAKADEAIKMLPFFAMVPILKRSELV